MDAWIRVARRLVALIFPERCILCGTVIPPGVLCCQTCREQLQVIRPPVCHYCGMEKSRCHCRHKRHHYDRIVAPFYCEASARLGVLRLKRYADASLIRFLADQMTAVIRRDYGEARPDMITFVPITKRDGFSRGYNQSELVARAVGERLDVPVMPLLVKLYETKPQKELRARFRSGNVFGVFDVQSEVTLAGKTILLIDDVLTTGCTLNECAKMLKLYGAYRVHCVVAALRRQQKETSAE